MMRYANESYHKALAASTDGETCPGEKPKLWADPIRALRRSKARGRLNDLQKGCLRRAVTGGYWTATEFHSRGLPVGLECPLSVSARMTPFGTACGHARRAQTSERGRSGVSW